MRTAKNERAERVYKRTDGGEKGAIPARTDETTLPKNQNPPWAATIKGALAQYRSTDSRKNRVATTTTY